MKKIFLFIPLLSFIPPSFAEVPLTPGIYRIYPEEWNKVNLERFKRQNTSTEQTQINIQHAIPTSSNVKYAAVSRTQNTNSTENSNNKLMFIMDQPSIVIIKENKNPVCPTYAWSSAFSNTDQYCYADKEYSYTEQDKPYFKWDRNSFSIQWISKKEANGTKYISAERSPTSDEKYSCFVSERCNPPAFGKAINYYKQTYYHDVFKLETPKPYIDILYLYEDIPMYQKADLSSPVLKKLYHETYIPLISITPNWYEVDYVSTDGSTIHGWLNRNDLVKIKWYTQKIKTNRFSFKVGVDESEKSPSKGSPICIAVIDRKTQKIIQIIRNFDTDAKIAEDGDDDSGNPSIYQSDELLELINANFDQYPDLFMHGFSGGAGPNNVDNYFIYNPKTSLFELNDTLSSMTQLELNPKDHTVTTSQRSSCCSHSSETYKYINNKLTLIKSWEQHVTPEGKNSETTSYLKNGKWHSKTTETDE